MMISPDTYCERYLRGKTAPEILTEIRSLKRRINTLIRILEHPESMTVFCPPEDVKLICFRKYLEEAKLAYAEAGGIYTPTKAELKEAAFRENIPHISQIKLSVRQHPQRHETRLIRIQKDSAQIHAEHFFIDKDTVNRVYTIPKDDLLLGFEELYLSQWRRTYDISRYGIILTDGTQWDLEICFSNGTPNLRVKGDNAYPYNFSAMLALFDITWDQERLQFIDETS